MSGLAARDRNLELLRRLYVGLETGDVEEIRPLLAASIVVRVSGTGVLDGTYRGAAEAERLYRLVLGRLGPGFKVPPYDVLVHDESLVVVPRGTAFGAGHSGMDIYHFEPGGISEIWLTPWQSPGDDAKAPDQTNTTG